MILTDKRIDALRAPDARQQIAVDGYSGLWLIVQPTGAKSWAWRGRIDGKSRKRTLGAYPAYRLADAQAWWREVSQARDAGVDLVRERQAEERQKEADVQRTCQWAFELYMTHEGGLRKSAKTKWQLWNSKVKPRIATLPLSSLTRDVLTVIIDAESPNSHINANRTVSLIKRWTRWSVTKGYRLTGMTDDPASALVKPHDETPRDHVMSDSEIGILLRALDAAPGEQFYRVVHMLLLTACRRADVLGMRWSEIDIGRKEWTVPPERSKNGRPHLVPLSRQMLALLDGMEVVGGSDFVFPARGNPKAAMATSAKVVERLRTDMIALAKKEGRAVRPWRLHDMRRAFSTTMNAMTDNEYNPLLAPHVVETCLNHAMGSKAGVAGVYNRHSYSKEKRHAFALWNDYLDRLIAPIEMKLAA